MIKNKPNHAFILAAGQGKRLRPYTDTMPKPMVPVNGRPLLDYTIDKLRNNHINNITINAHYLGDSIVNYASSIHDLNVHVSEENELLDTGGGVKNALETMNNQPFYLINGDAFWDDGQVSAFDRLADFWDPEKMDILLLLQPLNQMKLTQGIGDYDITKDQKAVRSLDKTGEFMFGGIRITHPGVFENTPDNAFSFLNLMDKAQEDGRLYAIIHDSNWHHISTPADLEAVNKAYQNVHTPQKIKTA